MAWWIWILIILGILLVGALVIRFIIALFRETGSSGGVLSRIWDAGCYALGGKELY